MMIPKAKAEELSTWLDGRALDADADGLRDTARQLRWFDSELNDAIRSAEGAGSDDVVLNLDLAEEWLEYQAGL